MKHIKACAIMLIGSMVIPLHGGQPTRSSHMRKHSISITDLSKEYKVEIENAIGITPPLRTVMGVDFAWPLMQRPYEAREYSLIQQEIANEVACRHSLDERIQYLQSIAPLIKKYPEWLDAIPAKRLTEIKNRMEELSPSTPITAAEKNDDETECSMEEETWESDYQLFGERMVELSLED